MGALFPFNRSTKKPSAFNKWLYEIQLTTNYQIGLIAKTFITGFNEYEPLP